MTRKRRANQRQENRVVENTRPELSNDREVEISQIPVSIATHRAIRPALTQLNGRTRHSIVAGEVGLVQADLQTHQTSSFFPNSTGFEVSGGDFNSYRDHYSTGNVFINVNRPGNEGSVEIRDSKVPDVRRSPQHITRSPVFSEHQDGNWVSELPDPHLRRVTPHSPPPLPVQKSSEIYYRHLITSGRGSPLWIPEPSNTLPLEYQRAGIGIGDAIILTDSGGTDFLFNIYHPKGDSEDSINLPDMPEGYCPLDRPHNREVDSHVEFKNNSFLASSLVDSRRDQESPGLIFESSAMDGAILTMPNGANSTDLKNKTIFRRYVRLNAERWYKYANEVRGRDARNGDIRLVVGKTSTTTWGMATFANRSEQSAFRLKFKPTGNVGEGPATYGWEYSGMAEVKSGPDTHEVEKLRGDGANGVDEYENQCLFVRTINVTLQDDVWDKLMMEWERLDLLDDDGASSGSNSDSGLGSSGSQFSPNLSSSGRDTASSGGMSPSGGTFYARPEFGDATRPLTDSSGALLPPPRRRNRRKRSVRLSSFPPPIDLHPSKIINRFLLRERPHAKMAITEDDEWICLLDKNDKTFPNPNTLLLRMMTAYDIDEQEGVVFLKIRELPFIPTLSRPLTIRTALSRLPFQGRDLRRLHYNPKIPWPWVNQDQYQDLPLERYSEYKGASVTLIPLDSWKTMGVSTPPERESLAVLLEFLRSSLFTSKDITWPWKGFGESELQRLIKSISDLGGGDVRIAGKFKILSKTIVNGKVEIVGTIEMSAPCGDCKSQTMPFKTVSIGGTIPVGVLRRYQEWDSMRHSHKVKTMPVSFTFDEILRLRSRSREATVNLQNRYLKDAPWHKPEMKYRELKVTPQMLANGTKRHFISVGDVLSAVTRFPDMSSSTNAGQCVDDVDENSTSAPMSLPFSIQQLPHEWERWVVKDKIILDEFGKRYVMK